MDIEPSKACRYIERIKERDKIGPLMEELHAANVGFADLYTKEPHLEEVFMTLTSEKDD